MTTPASRAWLVLFGGVLLLLGGLVVYRYLPLVDWPEHCKMAAIRSHLHEPAFGFEPYFEESSWFLPYQTFRWLQILLGRAMGDRLGFAVALWPYLLGVPILAAVLQRRLGRDPWLVFISAGVVVEGNLLWGFAPYVTGIAVLLLALVVTIEFLDKGGWLRGAAVVAVDVLAFFTHPESAALQLGSSGLLALVAARQGVTTPRRAAWVVASALPSAVMLVLYLSGAGWLDDKAPPLEFFRVAPTVFRPPWETVRNLGFDSGLTVLGVLPAIAFLLSVAVALVVGKRDTQRQPWMRPMWMVVGAWAVLLFVAPASVRGEPVGLRLSSGLALLLTLVLPVGRQAGGPRWPQAIWVASCLAALVWTHHAFAAYDRSLRPLDRITAQIPVKAKLATMVYEVYPAGIALPAYVHLGGYITTARGGLPAFTFQAGITLKKSVPRACMLVVDDWRPYYGWQIESEKAACWDYLVVRKGKAFPGRPFADPAFKARLLVEDGDFQLWDLHP